MEMADPTLGSTTTQMKQHLSPCEDPGSGLITIGQYCYSPLFTSQGHCGLDGTGHLAKVTKLVAEVGFRLSLPILRVHTASPTGSVHKLRDRRFLHHLPVQLGLPFPRLPQGQEIKSKHSRALVNTPL